MQLIRGRIPRYTKTNKMHKNCANQSYERVHKIQIVNFNETFVLELNTQNSEEI